MKQKVQKYDDDEITIDLLELFTAFKKRLWLIILATIIGGGGAGAFSKFVLTPQYSSTTMLYVLSKETTLTSLADLQIGSQLTKDYRIIITSRPVLEETIQALNLDITYKELRKLITIDNPTESRILTITVTDPDPYLAKQIVDKVSNTASDYIGDLMEMVPPKMIEDGEVAQVPNSPNNRKNALLGGLGGAALVCGLIALSVILNDTIRTEDDVEKYLGLTVLAALPAREGEESEEEKTKKRKKVKEKPEELPRKRSRKKSKRRKS